LYIEPRPGFEPGTSALSGSETQVILNDVVKRVESLEKRVSEFGKVFELINISLGTRLRFSEYNCIYIDSKGYCKWFYWNTPLKDFEVFEVVEKGVKRYYLNVKKYPWFCLPCPKYTPKYLAETLGSLKTRLETLESQVSQLQQAVSQQSDKELREALERLKRPGF
jgi:chaperonin cofactor prefoldin